MNYLPLRKDEIRVIANGEVFIFKLPADILPCNYDDVLDFAWECYLQTEDATADYLTVVLPEW